MKPYFVAALSFVGVLGSAAGAMAINNDTLTHGGTELTESASRTLISTSTVNPDGTLSIDGSAPTQPGVIPGSDPSASGMPQPSGQPQALTNLPTLAWNGSTGGSTAAPGSAAKPAHSAARPIATPASGSSAPVSGVTGGSTAAAPAAGSTGGTPSVSNPSRGKHPERGKTQEHSSDRDNESDDSQESDDD